MDVSHHHQGLISAGEVGFMTTKARESYQVFKRGRPIAAASPTCGAIGVGSFRTTMVACGRAGRPLHHSPSSNRITFDSRALISSTIARVNDHVHSVKPT